MTPMTPRERRLVAVALLAAAICLPLFGIILPIANGFAERAETREQLITTHERQARALGRLPFWRRAATAQRRDLAAFRIDALSETAAADLLRERLGAVAARSGVAVKSIREAPGSPGEIRAAMEFQASLPATHAFLRSLTGAPPWLVVETVSIGADAAFGSGHLEPIDVRIEVAAPIAPSIASPAS